MHAPQNPFQARRTKSRAAERFVFWLIRLGTYSVLAAATFIFLDIGYKGGRVVFQSTPPFINVPFLTQKPETLYVFDYEGKKMQMGDTEFRAFKQAKGGADISAASYVYSAGGIFPCIVGTVLLVVGSMTIALILGVSSAIYLSEYSQRGAHAARDPACDHESRLACLRSFSACSDSACSSSFSDGMSR